MAIHVSFDFFFFGCLYILLFLPFLHHSHIRMQPITQESSVWEVESISHHYYPDVSTAPEALRTPALNKRDFDIEKAAKLSYGTMLGVSIFD